MRNPIDRLTVGLPRELRVTIDWLVTILGAILIVLAIKQWVINPYRIPSSSMEPTRHKISRGRVGRELQSGAGSFMAVHASPQHHSPKKHPKDRRSTARGPLTTNATLRVIC